MSETGSNFGFEESPLFQDDLNDTDHVSEIGDRGPNPLPPEEEIKHLKDMVGDLQQSLHSYKNQLQFQRIQADNSQPNPNNAVMLAQLKLEQLRLENRAKEVQLQAERERRDFASKFPNSSLTYDSITSASPTNSSPGVPKIPKIPLPKLDSKDDVDKYLCSFEHIAQDHGVHISKWITILAPKLTGKARDAYNDLGADCTYADLKAAILAKYELTAEAYRLKFRRLEREQNQSVKEYVSNLERFFTKWLEFSGVQQGDYYALFDLIISDQAYFRLPTEITQYVKEKEPANRQAMSQLADKLVDLKGGSKWLNSLNTRKPKPPQTDRDKKTTAFTRSSWTPPASGGKTEYKKYEGTKSYAPKPKNSGPPTCYHCNTVGHIKANCPRLPGTDTGATPKPKPVFFCGQSSDTFDQTDLSQTNLDETLWKNTYKGTINGEPAYIVRDECCAHSVVHTNFVKSEDYIPNKTITIRGAIAKATLPMAKVQICCPLYMGEMTVGVADTIPTDMLFGNEMEKLSKQSDGSLDMLFGGSHTQAKLKSEQTSETLVVNRQQAKIAKKLHLEVDQNMAESGVKPHQVDFLDDTNDSDMGTGINVGDNKTTDTHDNTLLLELPYAVNCCDDDIKPNIMTKTSEAKLTETTQNDILGNSLDPAQLKHLQQIDKTLTGIRDRALTYEASKEHRVCFYVKDGVLFRKWSRQTANKTDTTKTINQIVVPQPTRAGILKMAHDIPMSGHLGINKTKDRILASFYWPGIFADVAKYCRTCDICQKTAKFHYTLKAPLHPIPIVGKRMEKIGIDILGPLPRSTSRKAYILTVIDYATRYPWAKPLSNITTESVAQALCEIFSEWGLPEQILSDQGTNFLSKTMQELYKLMQIEPNIAAPFHHETAGLVENFNGTIKSMLRTLSDMQFKEWDKYLPLFMFAYREVPQASLGFSPFELVFAEPVRGPLDIIRESWTGPSSNDKTVIQYIVDLRDKLHDMTKQAHEHLEVAQQRQKTWYDKHSRDRSLRPGQQVLVLLPTHPSKVLTRWQGPYIVTRKVNDLNYEIDVGKKNKNLRYTTSTC
ncbi:uncharacterized protein [Amphiura filiformis]|uniref:uncharacterized protein n=1 Tax=Amphiura filiformis TaxID=82378 RepID=UPI003B2209B6